MKLCEYNKSFYNIVVSENASEAENYAASELSMFLFKVTGSAFTIKNDSSEKTSGEIVVGKTKRELCCFLNRDILKNDGFTIKAKDGDIYISGKNDRGTLYGVYSFLEYYAGIEFIAYDQTVIPVKSVVKVPDDLDITEIPPFEYRDIYYREIIGYPDFSARRKCNGFHGNLTEKHGGKFVYQGFVHTFNSIIPPEKYFETNPEYFSLINGLRTKDYSQLCLTNPEVLETAKKYVRSILEKNPNVNIISVSQNDCYNPCQCDECKKVDEFEGSHAGTLINFVNVVADSIKDDYPDVIIDTLAYQYTRKCPKHVKPRDNVAVRLCTIECCFSHPLTHCNKTGALEDFGVSHNIMDDFDEWSKISKRLYVWDYVTDFCHYLLPHPNLHILADNVRFFIDQNVAGLFEQGCGDTINSDFGALRAYVLSKVMWNPKLDANNLINVFLHYYYGKAEFIVREYIDLFIDKVNSEDICVGTFAYPDNAVYSKDIMDKAEALIKRAKEAVSGESDIIKHHVEILALCIEYFRLFEKRADADPDEVYRFIHKCISFGMTNIREWHRINLNAENSEKNFIFGK